MKILLTGGGSGGHISPALAVAEVLRKDSDIELLYVGGKMTMEGSTGPSIEEKLVVPTGIAYVSIRAGKLRRDGLSLATLKRLWGVVPGFFDAFKTVKQFHPDVVFSSGGYVSLPVVWAAALLRVPIVIHEQTAVVGLANSLAGRVATKVAITFAQSAQYFPQHKVQLTGNPIRPEVLAPKIDKSPLSDWLKSADKPVIYITGGGLGAHNINVTIEQMLPQILDRYCVVLQCGAHSKYQDYERLLQKQSSFPTEVARRFWPTQFFTPNEVGLLYRQASLVIARSGANTVLELAAVGVPAIFIPIPWVTHDEQTKNAQVLVQPGMAVIVPEKELSADRLFQEIEIMVARLPQLEESRQAARQLVDFEATGKLVALIKSAAVN
jgi:UDP-N-acetylglucosamine--N-acetylmuramyl-(pentapeptide) pyrophosphoryl-undecaprenol N-acetylglucosamine transferase